MLSLESIIQPMDHNGMVEDVGNCWPRKIPEDVFHEGHLSFKVKGSYKYQTKWGVLRFESAMGPKRLELFEADTKDKCFQINANIYPTITIPFTQILGFYPQRTMRRGLFPIQVLLTYHKYQLATKTKEEQQQWLTKLNTIVYGSPRPNRTYEYMVMIFTTKLSNEVNLKGSYIFRVTEQSVHLISRDTSDHMTYTIPLCAIVKANHTVFVNSSIQFAPYSDRKSNIKVLALTIHGECDLKIGSYVFAATSAAEIVTIINERRLKSCNCAQRPRPIPIKTHSTLENGIDVSPTSASLLQEPTSTHCASTSLPSTPNLRQETETVQQSKRPQTLERDCKLSPFTDFHKSSTQSTNLKTPPNGHEEYSTPTSLTQISPKFRESAYRPRLKFHTNSRQLTEGTTNISSPISPPSTKVPVNTTLSTDATKNAKLVQPKHANFRNIKVGLERASTDPCLCLPDQPDKKPTSENTTAPTTDDNASTTSSNSGCDHEDFEYKSDSSSHDYNDIVNKTSPSGSLQSLSPCQILYPPPPFPSTSYSTPSMPASCATPTSSTSCATPTSSISCVTPTSSAFCVTPSLPTSYVNLDCTSNNQQGEELIMSPKLKRRSRSMGNTSNQPSPLHPRKVSLQPTHIGRNLQEAGFMKNQHFRSHSSDRTSIQTIGENPNRHHHIAFTNLATHFLTKSCETITPSGLNTTKSLYPYELSASYESILSNGPYEQISQSKLPSITVVTDSTQLRSGSSSPNNLLHNNAQTSTQVRGLQDEYETIKNSGPYETVSNNHNSKHDKYSKYPAHSPEAKSTRPVPLPRKKKPLKNATLFARTDSINMSKCKSLIRTTPVTPLSTMGKRSDSMGDLLDIRDNSEIYTNQSVNGVMLRGSLSSCISPLTPSNEHSTTQLAKEFCDCKHHVMNVQSPVEQSNTSPQALPYAMVWLDRL